MRLDEFDYHLPEELIASIPVEPRDHSRLLCYSKESQQLEHKQFFELSDLLRPGDLLVLNNSKVLPARIFGNDSTGRRFEVFLLKKKDEAGIHWSCLAKPGKKVRDGITLQFPEGVTGKLTRAEDEWFEIRFSNPENFLPWLFRNGVTPLPPYIKREADQVDTNRYQTVFAKTPGSVAAPTAGLHFTSALLESLNRKGVEIAEVTLHVGYGTFSPIKVEDITQHDMHEEYFEVTDETWKKIEKAKANGRRVIAVGTTALRTLESMTPEKRSGWTRLFITPGYQFQIVDGIITNFHLPKSSLYVLITAFLGMETTRKLYGTAIEKGYRFYSYGDAMFLS